MKKVRFGGQVSKNVIMLYVMNITQLILPLVTLPYLARVFSLNTYGVVSYTKNVMIYVNMLIEFGYLLSGTKEIVDAKESKDKISMIIGKITISKLILSIAGLFVICIMILSIKMLRAYPLFTFLMVIPQILSIFLFDYLFRGLEQMQIITTRFLIMRGISTILTFFVVKNDSDMIYIPILDILGTLVAVVWVKREITKLGFRINWRVPISDVFFSLRESFTYFISNIASTAFVAFNTIVVGIVLGSKQVAFWTMLMSLVVGVQGLYSPISDGIYPHMIKTKSIRLFRNVLLIFTPLLIIGCLITFFFAKTIVLIIGGTKYVEMYNLLQEAVPLLFVSFYSILCGWPLLAPIGKIKETTATTILAAIVQVIGVLVMIVTNTITLPLLIILRVITESIMLFARLLLFIKNKAHYIS